MKTILALALFSFSLLAFAEARDANLEYYQGYEDGYRGKKSREFIIAEVEFFDAAIRRIDEFAHDTTIVMGVDPVIYTSRVTHYLEKLVQKTIDPKRVAWSYYRVEFIDGSGQRQDCLGGLGQKKGAPMSKRMVTLEDCQIDGAISELKFDDQVDLKEMLLRDPYLEGYRQGSKDRFMDHLTGDESLYSM